MSSTWATTTRRRSASAIAVEAASPADLAYLATYATNLGPPPPSVTALVVFAIVGAGLLLLWAWWFDRHRTPIT